LNTDLFQSDKDAAKIEYPKQKKRRKWTVSIAITRHETSQNRDHRTPSQAGEPKFNPAFRPERQSVS
jgi:hypothetical protein